MRIKIYALIIFLLGFGTILPISSQGNTTNNLIAFVSEIDGDAEIYTIHSDGSNQRQLTNNSSYDDSPSWSPNGNQIVYVHEFELYIMNADGTNSTLLPNTFDARSPQWSPDGNSIVFEQQSEIMILDLLSATIQNLTNTPQEIDQNPIWSFDGSSIIFLSTGNNPLRQATEGDPVFDIYMMLPDGSNRTFLYQGGAGINSLSQSEDNVLIYTGFLNLDPTINRYDPLTNTLTNLTPLGITAYGAQFSPDGSQIALVYEGQIATMDTDGQNVVQITNIEGNILSLAWQEYLDLTPTPTPTTPPTTGDFTVTSRLDGLDDNQQAIFTYTLTNSSPNTQANLYMRLFFTVDNGRVADDYLLEAYYDSSNALLITGPFQWDATHHYFILSYGSSALAPNANYQFQGVLRLLDWGTDFSSANDWWHTGISTQDNPSDYLPVYANGVLNTGSEPSGTAQPTNTPAPTTTPDGTAVLQVENRTDGVDNNQQVSFRYRLTNIGTQAQGNLSTRIYFTLDGSEVASNYVLEQYYDQSGVATISGPTLASGNTYYFQVDYGATSLQPNSSWEFQGALHLVNYASNFSSSNDWWHTGIGSTYQETIYLPTYINGAIEVGQEP